MQEGQEDLCGDCRLKFMKKLMVIILGLSLLTTGCGVNTSNGKGEKIGQIVKISKQGLFNKTWEAQLIRGGMSGGNGSFGTIPFNFTIENEKDAEKVQALMENQTEVKISYRIEGIYSAMRSESQGHFLEKIEPVKK